MRKFLALITLFLGSFLFASEKLLPNGITPEAQHINSTWGLILFFMWPILIIVAYKFVEFTLKKSGVEEDL
ncbi:hypothetical protein NAMH_0091 [Nautilia profundicola AmH]|uniref:Uncharacterized protein n=1 Tax=Nautilia profundicola (strain ATCC BAA-1463 / DSM 18972 / AmH) TaxID=598659 RepID=B9L7C0_NAUPA|nr:hypothetical protein [Nautilia profundicola]ACM92155.1 hypothetical protein NAMH_0091 [Nautilia profundicola AmH]